MQLTAAKRDAGGPCVECGEVVSSLNRFGECPRCEADMLGEWPEDREFAVPARPEDHMAGKSFEREMWRERGY